MSTSRIRIISHSPLPIIKTWLPIPTNPASTLQDVSNSIADLLKTTIPFELELEGFGLLSQSSCSILDPARDVIDVKATETSSVLDSAPPLKRARISSEQQVSQPRNGHSFPAKPTPIKSLPQATEDSESSDSDSTSQDSSSSSDDNGTEVMSSLAKVNGIGASVVETNSSSSDDSSDISSSESDEGKLQGIKKVVPVDKRLVPPGQGLKRTQDRNRRKRLRRQSEIATNVASSPNLAPPVNKSAATSTTPATPTTSKSTPLDPYHDFAEPKLDMIHLAFENKNKKKVISLSKTKNGPVRVATRTTFEDHSPSDPVGASAVGVVLTPVPAPSAWTQLSTQISLGAAQIPPRPATAASTNSKSKSNSGNKKRQIDSNRYLPAPSARTDLPLNVIVTRVDVETDDWIAGAGEIIVGTSKDYTETVSPALLPFAFGNPIAVALVQSKLNSPRKEEYNSIEEVEKDWDRFKIIAARDKGFLKVGDLVGVKVLELDEYTCTPLLALKFGQLLSDSGSPGCRNIPSTTLRIQLHTSCLPVEEEQYPQHYELEGGDDDHTYDDAVEPESQDNEEIICDAEYGVWEGDWSDSVRLLRSA